MSLEQNDNYQIWKIKLQLAKEGNSQAIQQLKSICEGSSQKFDFIEKNFHDALKNSSIKYIKQEQAYGNYQMYHQVPIFIFLQGQIQLKCLNLQGDDQSICKYEQKNIIYVTKQKVVEKFGQPNLNIVTKFHLSAIKNSIIIEINEQSRRKIQNTQPHTTSLVGLRQQTIMKKYMLFPLKYIRIQQYQAKNSMFTQKLYLLQGHACYYYHKGKDRYLLTVYQQGYINPKQFQNSPQIKLYIFENSKVLIFQQQFMKDDVVAGTQSKRNQHIKNLIKSYQKVSAQQRRKIQIKLINNYKLNKKETQKNVLGIIQNTKQQSSKRISTKNDLISTSSSIKQKCKIRISKTKKKFV